MNKNDFIKSFDVSRETLNSFCEYEALLSKWNKKINLVSKNTLVDMWKRHFLDSGQVIKHVEASEKDGGCGLWSWFPWIGSCFIAKR